MFCDDTLSSFFGIQDGNKLTITGYTWPSSAGGPEIIFCNFSNQMIDENVSYFNSGVPETGTYEMLVRTGDSWVNKPYEYKNVTDINSNAVITNQKLFSQININNLEQNKEYRVDLSWYNHKATYYFEFTFDPSIISKGNSYQQ